MEFQLFIPMLPLIFRGKIGKMLVDLLKMSKILVDFLSFFEKSVEFSAPNTDWHDKLAYLLSTFWNMELADLEMI